MVGFISDYCLRGFDLQVDPNRDKKGQDLIIENGRRVEERCSRAVVQFSAFARSVDDIDSDTKIQGEAGQREAVLR